MIEWPDDLVDDIAARRSVLFLGAGVSQNAVNEQGERPLGWIAFLRLLASKISDEMQREEVNYLIGVGELLTACELARRYLSGPIFRDVMLQEFSRKAFQHTRIHEAICLVDSRFVLTTNFDKIYGTYANSIQRSTIRIKHYYDEDVADVFRRPDRVILKVHGSVDNLERAIFTRGQYAKARRDAAHFYEMLRGLFVTHTFVFLGASLKDPDMALLLEDHAARYGSSRPHYIVMPRDGTQSGAVKVLEETMNLCALQYDPKDHHAELVAAVEGLATAVQAARERMADVAGW